MHDAAKRVRPDILVLCHGGPIAEPDDAQYILDHTEGIVGFCGAGDKNDSGAKLANALGNADCVGMFLRTGVAGHTHFCLQRIQRGWGVLAGGDGDSRPNDEPSPTYFALAMAARLKGEVLATQVSEDEQYVLNAYAALRPPAALRRRAAFTRLGGELKLAVAQLIREVHQRWSVTFFARETLNLGECGTPLPDEDIEQACRILRRMNRTTFEIALDDPSRARILRVFEWQQADYARCSLAARGTPETALAWALARTWRGEETCPVPDEIDREEVARTQERLLAHGSSPAVWQVGRAGSELALARGSGAWNAGRRGSYVAERS